MTKILVSVSGGKDSQASLIWAIKKYGKNKVVPYFADTGWEHELTYKHISYLEESLDIKITTIKSDKYDGFEDMCIKRKTFPSRVRRFCTEELKLIPSMNFIRKFKNDGYRVINIVGVRAGESKSKKLSKPNIKNGIKWLIDAKRDTENMYKSVFLGILPKSKKGIKSYYTKQNAVTTIQPVVYWSEKEVYTYNIINGTQNNPLYSMGFTRVGCFPCISANVTEIGILDKDRVERINKLEKDVQDACTSGVKPVFFHKGGELKSFKNIHQKYAFNTLGFDLGCINHLGICE